MNYTAHVNYYLELSRREGELVRAELKKYPAGKLMVSHEKQGDVFFQVYDNDGTRKRRKITSKKDLIRKLARKEYLITYRMALNECIDALSKCVDALMKADEAKAAERILAHFSTLPQEWFRESSNGSAKLHPSESYEITVNGPRWQIKDMSAEEWMSIPYRANSFRTEEKIHRSSCGVMMRSKGEIAWAERLLHWGVAFHYDELICCVDERISPDFIVMRKDGRLFYIEHCGLMEDEKYRQHHKRKLEIYESGGIVPWDNLIVTYDRPDGSIDMEMIDAIIKSKLLI